MWLAYWVRIGYSKKNQKKQNYFEKNVKNDNIFNDLLRKLPLRKC